MNTLRIAFAAALLFASSAYADATPHWTAAIGTGHASESTSNRASIATRTHRTSVGTSPHWTAFIGTGRTTEAKHSATAKASAAGSPAASAHWTSRIGTGQASDSGTHSDSSAVTAARARP
jgi:hypothetical protein